MKNNKTLSSLGEFGLIEQISAHARSGEGVVTGIGDDASVTSLTDGMQLLTSVDMLLEDVHFRKSWHPPRLLGRKSLAVSLSDVAAMGAIPRWAALGLGIPSVFPFDFLDEYINGFLEIAKEYSVSLIGGDTCLSRNGLIISVTIMAEQFPDLIVRRSGAKPGDDIWVTGTLGDSAMALEFLEKDETGAKSFPMDKLLNPTPRIAVGRALAETSLVTAMIDISDGLLSDYGHIAKQSEVGGIVYLERLPLSGAFRKSAAFYPDFPYQLALSGGEDYELVFTASPNNREKIHLLSKKHGVDVTAVGIVTDSSETTIETPDGVRHVPTQPGYNHFMQ